MANDPGRGGDNMGGGAGGSESPKAGGVAGRVPPGLFIWGQRRGTRNLTPQWMRYPRPRLVSGSPHPPPYTPPPTPPPSQRPGGAQNPFTGAFPKGPQATPGLKPLISTVPSDPTLVPLSPDYPVRPDVPRPPDLGDVIW